MQTKYPMVSMYAVIVIQHCLWIMTFPGLWYNACSITVKILKIGTPEIITIIVLHLEQLDFTVQYCVQKMQTE